jgi:hypothetical protein
MKARKLMTAFILGFLFSSVASTLVTMDAKANPYGTFLSLWKDKIVVDSPQNSTYSVGTLQVNFTIEYAETQTVAFYKLNDQQRVYVEPNNVVTKTGEGYTYTPSTGQNTTFTLTWYMGQYSFPIQNLTEGTYNLTIQRMRGSATVNFTIDKTPPDIIGLSVENKTYAVDSLPLQFIVSEQTSWKGYSLNNQANITVVGNTTLASLSDGSHSIVVYSNDTAGNMGKSDTIFFMVDTSTPKPSPTNYSSQQPTSASYPRPADLTGFYIFAGIIVLVIMMALGAVVYFKRRRD